MYLYILAPPDRQRQSEIKPLYPYATLLKRSSSLSSIVLLIYLIANLFLQAPHVKIISATNSEYS